MNLWIILSLVTYKYMFFKIILNIEFKVFLY